MTRVPRLVLSFTFCLALLIGGAPATRLQSGFYKKSCPGVEPLIEAHVAKAVIARPRLAAQLLRLHFHDCFVQGCDASILLDATDDEPAEKDADINLTVAGYEFIDELKSMVEAKCPETVSCADILALSARDSVRHSGGPWIPLLTGRRDGFGSRNPGATSLPTFVGGVRGLERSFAKVGLNMIDMIALSGGHTIGKGSCLNVQERLPPFQPDGLLDPGFLKNMSKTCIRNGRLQENNLINLDTKTPDKFDNQYFQNLLDKKGTFISDSLLRDNRKTRAHVRKWAKDRPAFFNQFRKSFLKMSQIQVLTGGRGEIRLDCRVTNQY